MEKVTGIGGVFSVELDPERYPNGRFASRTDPEGNPIQLWQPEDPAARAPAEWRRRPAP